MPYFNNNYQQGFAQPFQPTYQYQQPPMQQSFQSQAPQPSNGSGLTWVQGEIGARAYPVQPGMSILLMDSEAQNFYIKSADGTGMPTMKKYAYSEVVEEPMRLESRDPANFDTANLASRDEVKQLQEKIKELESQIASMSSGKKQGGQADGQK